MERITAELIDCELRLPRPEDLDKSLFVQIDKEKCTGCGLCADICPTGAIAGKPYMAHSIPFADACTHCGLCLVKCPQQSIYETRSWLAEVEAKLDDPDTICISMPAPSIRYALGEAFGLSRWTRITEKIYSALLKLGFRHCWDVGFASDVTLWEEGTKLIELLNNKGPFPLFSSFCASWQRFVENFEPDILPLVSTSKSPGAINGRLAKSWGADRYGYSPSSIYTVAIMPCPAKKHEALRPELCFGSQRDIDAVLTARELVWLLRRKNIDPVTLQGASPDPLMGTGLGGNLFGISGGVLDNLARFVSQKMEGRKIAACSLSHSLNDNGIHEYTFKIKDETIMFAHLEGAEQFATICEMTRKGNCPYHYVEAMACTGGCINGSGQPLPAALKRKPA